MDWVGAIAIVFLFVIFLQLFRVVSSSKEVVSIAGNVLSVVKDKDLSDLEKEKTMQRYTVVLLKHFFLIALGCALALAIPLGFIWGFERLGLMSFDRVMDITLSWQFILATTVLGFAFYYLVVKKRG